MAYNYYRKRHYNISKTKSQEYAQSMQELENYFDTLQDWDLSRMKDSCYKIYDDFELRLSNHAPTSQYHNLQDAYRILVNLKASKLDFKKIIETKLSTIEDFINTLDLTKYRYINIVDNKVNCYIKNFKTKKEVYQLN